MSDDLYNVVIPYGFEPLAVNAPSTFKTISQQAGNMLRAIETKSRAATWLKENDRIYDLVNVYDNQVDGLLFKFRSLETALLFRLSL